MAFIQDAITSGSLDRADCWEIWSGITSSIQRLAPLDVTVSFRRRP